MSQKAIKIWRILSNMLMGGVVLLAFLLMGIRLFGLQVYTVLSGSMEPDYPTGSLVYVKETDPAALENGDVITFRMANGTVATHRIIELVPDEEDPQTIRFRTKGDANEIVDGSLVGYDSVIGRVVFCLPLLGYLAALIMQPAGRIVTVAVALILVLSEVMLSMLSEDKNQNKKEKTL